MKVDIRDADLIALVARVRAGEEVVIEDGAVPVARLVAAEEPRPFRLGLLEGLGGAIPDFPPIPDEDLDQWEREEAERIGATPGSGRP